MDNTYDVGRYASLGLDAAGHPHISYYDALNGGLRYAYHDGSSWHIEILDDSSYFAGMHTSLDLDAAGRPHIIYWNGDTGTVYYTWKTGAEWETQAVDHSSSGPYPSMVLDATNRPHFSYAAGSWPSDLHYAWQQAVLPTAPISYTWDLGDETRATGISVTHRYSQPGTFTVVLTASNCGDSALVTAAHTLVVTPSACEPVYGAGFDWSPQIPATGDLVTFSGVASGSQPISLTWDLGGGIAAAGVSASHSFTTAGDYSITMTATNGCGQAIVIHPLTVQEPINGLLAANTSPTTLGQPTMLNATIAAGSHVSYTWELGDGAYAYGAIVSHTYPAVSIYTAVVTASNRVSTETTTTTVIVIDSGYTIYLPLVVRSAGAR